MAIFLYYKVGKQEIDIFISFLLLIMNTPLIGIIAVEIFLRLGRPVFFAQSRPGLNGLPFTIYIFRTMSEEYDQAGRLLPDSLRISRLGRFLRKRSLDELPELFNVVLKGDMSLVGPRPLLMQYIDRYTPEQAGRLEVNPGITGWAQVNGRNAITWEEKVKYDVWYVDNWSLWRDIKIIFMTIIKVLKREDISQPGYATMDEFIGRN